MENQHPVETPKQRQIVGYDNQRLGQRRHGYFHDCAVFEIKLVGWLIENEDLRFGHQKGGKRCKL